MNTEQDQRVRKLAYLHGYLHGYRAWKPRSDRHWQYQPHADQYPHQDHRAVRGSLDEIEDGLRDG
jgi:hypothetical protein